MTAKYHYDVKPGPKIGKLKNLGRRPPDPYKSHYRDPTYHDFLLNEDTPHTVKHPFEIKGKWIYPGPGLMQWRK